MPWPQVGTTQTTPAAHLLQDLSTALGMGVNTSCPAVAGVAAPGSPGFSAAIPPPVSPVTRMLLLGVTATGNVAGVPGTTGLGGVVALRVAPSLNTSTSQYHYLLNGVFTANAAQGDGGAVAVLPPLSQSSSSAQVCLVLPVWSGSGAKAECALPVAPSHVRAPCVPAGCHAAGVFQQFQPEHGARHGHGRGHQRDQHRARGPTDRAEQPAPQQHSSCGGVCRLFSCLHLTDCERQHDQQQQRPCRRGWRPGRFHVSDVHVSHSGVSQEGGD